MRKPITPAAFDRLASRNVTATARDASRIIWTAAGIGQHLGCGEDYVRRTLAKVKGTPVRQIGRRLYAFEDELLKFMRSTRNTPHKPVR